MPLLSRPFERGRWLALGVLVSALAVTLFASWRERKLALQAQTILWQESLNDLQPALMPILGQSFEPLRDYAQTTSRRGSFSQASWKDFLLASEWQQRYPGMLEIGYAEPGGARCPVKFLASRSAPPAHPPGFDLNSNPTLSEAVHKAAQAGFGVGSRMIPLRDGTNSTAAVVGLIPLPLQERPLGSADENEANVRGFIFFALNQPEYFRSFAAELKRLRLTLRLLAPDEPLPPVTPTQRPLSINSVSGEWRFLATMKSPPAGITSPQWVVLLGGVALSLLLGFLFDSQARLRLDAQRASLHSLQQEREISLLNRDLEEKIAARTADLHLALEEEKELNRLKTRFISMVTHEIRTPLSLVLSSSEILSRYLDRLPPERRAEHLRTIGSAVHRMEALVDDVLVFSKTEGGRMDFNPEPLELTQFCSRLVQESLSATNNRCPIELRVDPVRDPARGDETLLRHIFGNLLANAAKYSAPGSPVRFSMRRERGHAVFTVQDCGMGIAEEDRPRLFTPFYRGKNVATIEGTGLGLVIVKHCVERHGGAIEIASSENSGTTVTVRLPLFSPAHTDFVQRLEFESI